LFLLPVPTGFIPAPTTTLQRGVAAAAAQLLDVCGVPTYCDGIVVQLSDFTLVANAASSGLRELEGTSALCLAAALVCGGGWLRSMTFVLLCLPIALAVNVVRIVAAGVAFHEQGRPAAERVLQVYEGWVPVGVAAGLVIVAALVIHALTTLVERSQKETT
jgi:exosortase